MSHSKKPHEPHKYSEIKNYSHKPKSKKHEVSIPPGNLHVLPKTRERSAPNMDGRHDKFQFGTNPMTMTAFERELVAKEKDDRKMASEKYISGIQGRDGGEFPHNQFDEVWPDKF